MGYYDAKGVNSKTECPYGVKVRAAAAAATPDELNENHSKLVCKVKEWRIIFQDRRRLPPTCAGDNFKMRIECHVSMLGGGGGGGNCREELEAWLTSHESDICASARDDILSLVFDEPNSSRDDGIVGLDITVDEIIPGRDDDEDDVVYWESESEDEDEEDKDGPISDEAFEKLDMFTLTPETKVDCGEGVCCLDENPSSGDLMFELPCSHTYHLNCIQIWFFEHRYCPTCCYKFPIKSYKDYPCVCDACMYQRELDPSGLPRHSPPHYRFY